MRQRVQRNGLLSAQVVFSGKGSSAGVMSCLSSARRLSCDRAKSAVLAQEQSGHLWRRAWSTASGFEWRERSMMKPGPSLRGRRRCVSTWPKEREQVMQYLEIERQAVP